MRIAVLDKGQSCNDVPGVDQADSLRLSLVTAQVLLRDVMSRRCEGILAEVPSHISKFTYHPSLTLIDSVLL
jgi:hypothetical protein